MSHRRKSYIIPLDRAPISCDTVPCISMYCTLAMYHTDKIFCLISMAVPLVGWLKGMRKPTSSDVWTTMDYIKEILVHWTHSRSSEKQSM